MRKPIGIIAYGKPEDRNRLAAIAASESKTGSKVIIDFIRARYTELYGEMDPTLVKLPDQE